MEQPVTAMENEGSPVDSIISRVQSYKANPSLVTPETLDELLVELQGVKQYIDGEDAPVQEAAPAEDSFSGEVARRAEGM